MKNLYLFLLLCGLSLAWTSAPPAQFISTNLNGVNFAYWGYGQPLSNGVDFKNFRFIDNCTNYVPPGGGITITDYTGGVYQGSVAGAGSGVASSIAFGLFPPNGNITLNSTAVGAGHGTSQMVVTGFNGSLTITNTGSINGYQNGTNYILNSSTTSIYVKPNTIFMVNVTDAWNIQSSSTVWSISANYNLTGTPIYAPAFTLTAACFAQPSTDYHSGYLLSSLVSDFRNFSYSAPAMSSYFPDVLLSPSSAIVLPEIVYFPGNDSFPNFYNMTIGSSFMRNNTAAYIYDQDTLAWYFVPPLVVASNSVIYTESVYYVASGQNSQVSIPVIPLFQSCRTINGQFTINATFFSPVNHSIDYGNSTAMLNYQASSSSIFYQVPLANYTYANYSANGNPMCAYSNSTSILPLPTIGFPAQAAKTLVSIFFIGTFALGFISPLALIFAAAFNDTYGFLSTFQMAIAIVACGFGSLLVTKQSASLKSLFFYVLIGISTILMFSGNGVVFTGINMTSLTNFYTTVAAFSQNSTTTNIYSFTVATAAFLVNLGILIISVPALARSFIISTLMVVSPMIGSLAAPIADAFVISMVLSLFMFFYEIIRNLFPRGSTGGGILD